MTLSLQAQKFGYMNSAGILASMPEVKSADATLEVTQKQYQEKGKKMVEEYQMKVQELQKKEQEGTLSPKQIEEEAAKLRAQEETIAKFEQEMNTNLGKKRNELLNPILTRVNEMIQTVAKENGFSFVFDASPGTGILLYADETLDITPLVLAKLGISLPASSN
jgi:outer membrane protein